MAVPTTSDIEAAGFAAYRIWEKDAWECEDQARACLHAAQLQAAKEGRSWACGILRADSPPDAPSSAAMHVYFWAVVKDAAEKAPRVIIYDPSARKFRSLADVRNVDYSMT